MPKREISGPGPCFLPGKLPEELVLLIGGTGFTPASPVKGGWESCSTLLTRPVI